MTFNDKVNVLTQVGYQVRKEKETQSHDFYGNKMMTAHEVWNCYYKGENMTKMLWYLSGEKRVEFVFDYEMDKRLGIKL